MRLRLLPRIALIFTCWFQCLEGHSTAADEPLRIGGKTMGSYYAIVVDSPGNANAEQLKEEIEALFGDINRQMSTWDENSEISRFNRSTSTHWFTIGKDFAIVIQEANRVHEISGGAFDPTLAPLIDAWGYGAKKARRDIPSDEAISNSLRNVGLQHVEFRTDPPAIRKSIPELRLTLSAIAPGYATDEVCRILRTHQLSSHVVDVGGENRAGKAKGNGEAWRVEVESPLGGNLHKVVELKDTAIATSGDYRNFFIAGGKKYAHILDPKTGRPVEHPAASVSVVHQSCMTADALCTALMVLGKDRGLSLARKIEVDVMFLEVDDSAKVVETSIGIFSETE